MLLLIVLAIIVLALVGGGIFLHWLFILAIAFIGGAGISPAVAHAASDVGQVPAPATSADDSSPASEGDDSPYERSLW